MEVDVCDVGLLFPIPSRLFLPLTNFTTILYTTLPHPASAQITPSHPSHISTSLTRHLNSTRSDPHTNKTKQKTKQKMAEFAPTYTSTLPQDFGTGGKLKITSSKNTANKNTIKKQGNERQEKMKRLRERMVGHASHTSQEERNETDGDWKIERFTSGK